jgi:hypothetical protein
MLAGERRCPGSRHTRDDLEQQVRLVELGDVLLELEALQDVLGVRREAADEGPQVGGQVVGVTLQLPNVNFAGVPALRSER